MIRSEAKAMGKLKKNNPRNNNQSKNNRSNHQNGNRRNNNNRGNSNHNHHRKNNQQNRTNNDNKSDNDGMGLPPNVWNQLQGPQKKAYLEGRKALRNADPHRQREEIGKQESKTNDQKTKRESNNAVTNANNTNNQSKDDENGNTDRSGNAASRGTDSNDGWSIVTPRQPRTIRFSNQFNRARAREEPSEFQQHTIPNDYDDEMKEKAKELEGNDACIRQNPERPRLVNVCMLQPNKFINENMVFALHRDENGYETTKEVGPVVLVRKLMNGAAILRKLLNINGESKPKVKQRTSHTSITTT